MSQPWNILVLCTGNSARSILAEALFNALGGGRVRAFSAGSKPAGKVNPCALELLEAQGLETANLRSKRWDEFAAPGAPELDLVVTVCGNAANETCPVWPGDFLRAHWGVDDPAAVAGSDEEKRAAFMKAYALLAERILVFLSLSFETMERAELQKHLDEIGRAGAAAAVPEGLTFSYDD
jgi:protein-tyrosine-phosphatase